MSLKNGENWALEDYEGKFGDFEFTSQITPSRLRGVPSSKYLTTSWYGYGTPQLECQYRVECIRTMILDMVESSSYLWRQHT
jgi:hypothetical protein